MEENVYVGRQPIFDNKGNIYAYELLYRNSAKNSYQGDKMNPDKTTLELLLNTFFNIGIDEVSGTTKSFLNFSETLLEHEVLEHLDPNNIVIEILEDAILTIELISQIKKVKEIGFKIALDDFDLAGKDVSLVKELFKNINILKIDFLQTSPSDRRMIERIAKVFPHISLLAEKVENAEMHEEALQYGYKLFQGYYFSKPEIIKRTNIPANYAMYFHLFSKLNVADPDVDELTNLMKRDVSISYKLLRYINSLPHQFANEITSIKQAIMLLGLDKVKLWMRIVILYDLGDKIGKGRERALIDKSLTRGKICELLAIRRNKVNVEEFFLLGMFSLISVMLQQPWEGILPKLSLSEKINDALLEKDTEMRPYLQLSIGLEELDYDLITYYGKELAFTSEELSVVLAEAHKWATKFEY